MVGRPALPTPFWMLPIRDLLSMAEIATSFGVDEVVWRGHKLGTNSDARPTVVPVVVETESTVG